MLNFMNKAPAFGEEGGQWLGGGVKASDCGGGLFLPLDSSSEGEFVL